MKFKIGVLCLFWITQVFACVIGEQVRVEDSVDRLATYQSISEYDEIGFELKSRMAFWEKNIETGPTYLFYHEEHKFVQFDYKEDVQILKNVIDPNKGLALIIHGWTDNYEVNGWMDKMKNFLLQKSNYTMNVVIVDWSRGSKHLYKTSKDLTFKVGEILADFLVSLNKAFNIDYKKVQLIGHSLGGQISGFTGKEMIRRGKSVGRITALDPANFHYTFKLSNHKITKDDADLVEVFHSNMAILPPFGYGMVLPAGHVDFYLNGGKAQTGCFADLVVPSVKVVSTILEHYTTAFNWVLDKFKKIQISGFLTRIFGCSHNRIHDYYATDFESENCQPVAYRCESLQKFTDGKCADCGPDNSMCQLAGFFPNADTFNSTPTTQGYYLYTSGKSPFCMHAYQIKIKLNNHSGKTLGKLTIQLKSSNYPIWIDHTFDGYLDPNQELTKLFYLEYNVGKIEQAVLKFKIKKVGLYEYYARNVMVDSFELNYLSHINIDNRLDYSSSSCDFEILNVTSKASHYQMC